jgi:hypothetical protein
LLLETSIVVTLRLRVLRVDQVDQAVPVQARLPPLVEAAGRDPQVLDHKLVAAPRGVRRDTT